VRSSIARVEVNSSIGCSCRPEIYAQGARIQHRMKRKLGIVQAFQPDPPLLILDEPTEGSIR
jgi:ABC-type branched-subunit amino acid transport system ATPase component